LGRGANASAGAGSGVRRQHRRGPVRRRADGPGTARPGRAAPKGQGGMTQRVTVRLDAPAHEMAQEEIQKQVAYLAKGIGGVRFAEGGVRLELEAPADAPRDLDVKVKALARHVQRSLRSLRRKVLYRSPAMDRPAFRGTGAARGVHLLANGQAA